MTGPFPTHCWCGRPVQTAEDHRCRQCGEHCEIRAYMRREALSRRPDATRLAPLLERSAGDHSHPPETVRWLVAALANETARADGWAARVDRVEAAAVGLRAIYLAGEFARGVAQATRDMLAALDDPDVEPLADRINRVRELGEFVLADGNYEDVSERERSHWRKVIAILAGRDPDDPATMDEETTT